MIFLESPWPILFTGLVAEVILLVILFKTGRGVLLWAIGGVALVVALGVLLERLVVTDKKLVAQTLNDAAAALEANDLKKLDQFLSPSAGATRQQARAVMAEGEFTGVKIRSLDTTIVKTTSPRTAKTTFTAIISGRDRRGIMGQQTQPFRLLVRLQWEGGRWLILDHKVLEGLRGE